METALIASLEAKVSAECEAKSADAEREANAIVADARAKADERRRVAIARAQDDLAFRERRAKMVTAAEVEREGLLMQQSVVDEVLGRARTELDRLASSDGFGPVLESLLESALSDAPEDAVVMVPASQLSRSQAWLASHGRGRTTVEGSASLTDGVVIQDRTRTFRVTHTLSSRYAKLERTARKQSLRRLFPEGI